MHHAPCPLSGFTCALALASRPSPNVGPSTMRMQPLKLRAGMFSVYLRWHPDVATAAALVQAACTNLARCRPGIFAPGMRRVRVAEPAHCTFRLLPALPPAKHLILSMPEVGAAELAALGEVRSCLHLVNRLEVWHTVLPGFWRPSLWETLPALETLYLASTQAISQETVVSTLVAFCAAAPQPFTIKGLEMQGQGQQAELEGQLAALQGCKVKLVEVELKLL